MKQNQRGIATIAIVLALLLILAVGGFAVYRIQSNDSQKANETSDNATQTTETSAEFQAPADWKTVTEKGITVSYPAEWDEQASGTPHVVSVEGRAEDGIVLLGYGSPTGYRYNGGEWQHMTYNAQNVFVASGEAGNVTDAPASVAGTESTVLVKTGDAGCGATKLLFATSQDVYSITLPARCMPLRSGEPAVGVPAEDVDAALENIIRSIRIRS